jgi:phage terminase small subunit
MDVIQGVLRPKGLTDKEARFAEALVTGRASDLAAAAVQAGHAPKSAKVWGWRAHARPRVQEYMGLIRRAALAHDGGLPKAIEAQVLGVTVVPTSAKAIADTHAVMTRLTEILNSDIGDILELVKDPVLVKADGTPVYTAVISLEKAVRLGKTHLIDEVSITEKGITVKYAKKMEAVNALIRVLGMEEASEADRSKERAAVAAVLGKLPPELLERLQADALGPSRVDHGDGSAS